MSNSNENNYDNLLSKVNLVDILSKAEDEIVKVNNENISVMEILDYIYDKSFTNDNMLKLFLKLMELTTWAFNDYHSGDLDENYFYANIFNKSKAFRTKLSELHNRYCSSLSVCKSLFEEGDFYITKYKDDKIFNSALLCAIGEDRIIHAIKNHQEYILFCSAHVSVDSLVKCNYYNGTNEDIICRIMDCLVELCDADQLISAEITEILCKKQELK